MPEMSPRVLAYLQLVRLPNWFTAVADVMAGYLLVRGTELRAWEILTLMAMSSAIYGAGCVLNDLCDQELDLRERPFRPLPSGRVSVGEARRLLAILVLAPLALGFAVGGTTLFLVACLLVSVFSYNLVTKNEKTLGPFNMALCRGLNLLLGMSPHLTASGWVIVFPILTMAYVFSLTSFSRYEVEGASLLQARTTAWGWASVVGILVGLTITGHLLPGSLLYAGALTLATGLPLGAALLKPAPERVGTAVKHLVLGIPILDAVYVSGVHGWGFGLPVVFWIIPAYLLSRRVYVT